MISKKEIAEGIVALTNLTKKGKAEAYRRLMHRTKQNLQWIDAQARVLDANAVVYRTTGIINSRNIKK